MTNTNLGNESQRHDLKVENFGAAEKLLRDIVYQLTLLSKEEHQPFINRLEALRTSLNDGYATLKIKPLLSEISEYIQKTYSRENPGSESIAASVDIAPKISSIDLLKMIEAVKYPPAFQDQLEVVKAFLREDIKSGNSINTARALEVYFTLLIDFYDATTDQELEKFREYLHGLTTKLQGIDKEITVAENLRSSSEQACEEIDEVVNSEINQLEGDAAREQSIDEIKLSLQEHISIIRSNVKEYTGKENERLQKAAKIIQTLNNRVREVEQEAASLRKDLEIKHQQYLSDSLTGIPNRKAYEERILNECERYCRHDTPVSIIVCDVDHFKLINDKYGHAAGDVVLKNIALVLWESIRSVDFVARYGGEEFVIIMPGSILSEAKKVAEKLRKNICEHKFKVKNNIVPVTISGGIAQFREYDSPASIFERADNALYIAKECGRNRFELE